MKNRRQRKVLIVVLTSIITCLVAIYSNDILNNDAVYTSLFYIPLIMVGLWFYRAVIPLTISFAVFINVLDIIESGSLSIDQVFRGIIMILGAVVLYYMGRRLKLKNKELETSRKLLSIEKERLQITLLSIGDGVISTDYNGNVTLMNEVAKKLTGWPDESAIGCPFGEVFTIVNEYTKEKCEDPVKKVLEYGKVIELANHTVLLSKDGTERPIADSAAPIRDENGNLSGVVLVFRDVTSEKKKQSEIEFISFHDQLTGLGNRRYLKEQLSRLDNDMHLPLSVIMGDVNGLKLTNDAFGHTMGDKLLRNAAEILTSMCRNDDIICRYGGDEFLILLPNTTDSDAELITKRLRKAFSNNRIGPINYSISLGWAVKEHADVNMNDVIKSAEDFMYKIKLFESPSTRGNIIHNIMNTLKGSSERERAHSERCSQFCEKTARACNLGEENIEKYKTACMFHDIGKIAIDKKILDKTTRLNKEEWVAVKRHPEIGYRILCSVPDFAEIAEYVLAHHERWDGKGYPKGLKGEEIPYISRIIAITDSYDAMISERPYRQAYSQEKAIQEIINNAGTQYDPEVARIFVEKVLGMEWTK